MKTGVESLCQFTDEEIKMGIGGGFGVGLKYPPGTLLMTLKCG